MRKVLILYYSRHGSIRQLSSAVAKGVEQAGCEAVLRTVPSVSTVCEAVESEIPETGDVYATLDDLENCDGLILGSPTRFGSIAAPLKYFFDQSTSMWLKGTLSDKPSAVFTSSGSLHGGQESTLLSMMLPLLHHGMVVLGIPFHDSPLSQTKTGGTPYGASHVAGEDSNPQLSNDEQLAAEILGRRVANAAKALSGNPL